MNALRGGHGHRRRRARRRRPQGARARHRQHHPGRRLQGRLARQRRPPRVGHGERRLGWLFVWMAVLVAVVALATIFVREPTAASVGNAHHAPALPMQQIIGLVKKGDEPPRDRRLRRLHRHVQARRAARRVDVQAVPHRRRVQRGTGRLVGRHLRHARLAQRLVPRGHPRVARVAFPRRRRVGGAAPPAAARRLRAHPRAPRRRAASSGAPSPSTSSAACSPPRSSPT